MKTSKNILVSLKQTKYEACNLIEMKFTERERDTRRFILLEKTLIKAMTNEETVYEKDCNNFIELRYNKYIDRLTINVSWIGIYSNEEIKGYHQYCEIPGAVVWQFLETGNLTKCLYRDEVKYPRITFTDDAYKRIRQIVKDGGKRDLEKFFSKAFKYPNSQNIKIYDDSWINGFYFVEDDGRGISGGIVPHKKTIKCRDGVVREYTTYETHT